MTLSRANAGTVTARWATADGTARAGWDYLSASGFVTFAAGQTSASVGVTVLSRGGTGTRQFQVNLSAPTGGAAIGDGQGVGTVTVGGSLPKSLPAGREPA